MTRWMPLCLAVVLIATVAAVLGDDDPFAINGDASIMAEEHLGLVNGKLTAGIKYQDVAWVDGLWAPPYVSSNFRLTLAVHGRPVATKSYTWRPYRVDRAGAADHLDIRTTTTLMPGHRAGLLAITVENRGAQPAGGPGDGRRRRNTRSLHPMGVRRRDQQYRHARDR